MAEMLTEVTVNLNRRCQVTLTPAGMRVLACYFANLRVPFVPPPDSMFRPMLWELMQIFGPACYMGSTDQPLFDGNNITVVVDA